MNRKLRRQQEKDLRKKLTNEQYQDYKKKAEEEVIQERIDQGQQKTTEMITEALTLALSNKDFRISEKRQCAIIDEFMLVMDKKLEEIKGEQS